MIGGLTFPYFKIYYKSTIIYVVWDLHKDRNVNNWNKELKNKALPIWSNKFLQGAMIIQWGKEWPFQ